MAEPLAQCTSVIRKFRNYANGKFQTAAGVHKDTRRQWHTISAQAQFLAQHHTNINVCLLIYIKISILSIKFLLIFFNFIKNFVKHLKTSLYFLKLQ